MIYYGSKGVDDYMKLISCKCPNCGANVELNEKLEKGKCNGSDVINENFVNVNVGGEVIVSTIDLKKEIETVKKLYDSNDSIAAIDKLKVIFEKDLFNYEALSLYLKYIFSTYSYFELCKEKEIIKKAINRFETIKKTR